MELRVTIPARRPSASTTAVAPFMPSVMAEIDGIAGVAHFHAWALTESKPLITLEVTAAPGADPDQLRRAVKARLADRFDVSHATVEVVCDGNNGALGPAGQCSH